MRKRELVDRLKKIVLLKRLYLKLTHKKHIARYLDLLSTMTQVKKVEMAAVTDSLALKKPLRRTLPKSMKDFYIAGFGTDDDWRKNGIWAAFRAMTNFKLFEVPDGPYAGCNDDEEERIAKERDFLRFIDKESESSPFHFAFFSHSGRHISNQMLEGLKGRGIWTVVTSGDDKQHFFSPRDRNGVPHQLRIAGKADLYWTNWPFAIGLVNSLGGNGWFAPPAANPNFHHPIVCSKDLDVVFIGECYGARKEIINKLQRYFRVTAYGHGWPNGPVPSDKMTQLFSRAKIVLGFGGVGLTMETRALKARDFEVPMCGAVYLTSYSSELAECYDIGKEILCYASLEDCIESIGRIIEYPHKLKAIGEAARERSLQDHTWEKRLQSLFALWSY